ncbi:lanthionine synthetase C family protein [Streptomyces sp. NBC_01803]|uniref:lanthionine synthetase C family protein n=1 Tax=Streptomyces sp. NBC_01803 TaxID=2975946 RepID=UPI002DD83B2B|nr:lanthionine synthetase C family protein [Streptomyces sp. NBC_01803]WSA43699.1 lanthionine synthetase C family protein [Streptomyces sp. NBC_01803]
MTAPLPTGPAQVAGHLAAHLATPGPPAPQEAQEAQSLSRGAAGIALLHIERAHTGHGTWRQAHTWITAATASEVSAADTAGLYSGAPAIAFMLQAAHASSSRRYTAALATVDTHVAALAHRRVDAAMTRIQQGALPSFLEYDIFSGLTGIGAHLLRRDPGGSALERTLRYLAALTRPLPGDGRSLPGWWVGHDPRTRTSARYPGGHSNHGAAHGITGPLLLLSQAARRGITIDGYLDAIDTIATWLDTWKQDSDAGPWWPETVTLNDLRAGRPTQPGPARPSWCYGTPGITRALQLAALATGDTARQRAAEQALAACLSDPAQLARLTDTGLCHGGAGVYQTAWRAAQDAITPELDAVLPHLADALARHTRPQPGHGPGFLGGIAGTALALTTAARNAAPASGWDACLLID